MIVFLNGEFVPEEHAVVSVFDRSFRYGDGLFEAVLALNGKLFRWEQHWARFINSAHFFKLPVPWPVAEMLGVASELLRRNDLTEAMLRIQISRGAGPRGYAPTGQEVPVIVMTAHAAPARTSPPWKLTACPLPVASTDQLMGHKTGNRLIQILAASHARENGADEALLVNTQGHVCEGSTSNVFWIRNGIIGTPPLLPNILPGVTRAAVFEVARKLGVRCEEQQLRLDELSGCEGAFLTMTSRGVVEAASLEGQPLRISPLTDRLRDEMEKLIRLECA
jgi:branched-chain amino acid aminotransferase